ncbi:citrate lyase holo-[acyl-carrier protein] synthase [Fructilactobacillus florum]|uniref:citrate lyase holo-[acyl-carrier protein] synthase n=1 Tax=Fructilactobacillus florum DSM 22689 = JCM 16035 TaxID=1423745 RepID=A0A0R2CJ31_9LACO|nr:citrate lyase holo-[acyl-carrier protein] synthase [Fructilactobacillus florum]KRM91290.1 apo-citrate lyase phosphoribosyl-ft dephospho-CoA transferase [Fructilactobacillus florum DSM 22689 = JCM 16035]
MAINIFKKGTPQTIAEVLHNKDKRVRYQQQLLREFPDATVVAIKLNIPGPIKTNSEIEQLFQVGYQRFMDQLTTLTPIIKTKTEVAPTGPEAWLVVTRAASDVKHVAVRFEDHDHLGRLFDVDVLNRTHGTYHRAELSASKRTCFLCGRLAKECGRNRTHSVEALQAYVNQLYYEVFQDDK